MNHAQEWMYRAIKRRYGLDAAVRYLAALHTLGMLEYSDHSDVPF